MANKYIRHGATYCGDGSSSALATSDGASGAWNDINIFESTTPPYGALVAGDVVYIRSLDEAGNNIVRTLTADVNLGTAVATIETPVFWVLDNGDIWAGVDGTLSYEAAISSNNAAVLAYNTVAASTIGNLVFEFTGTYMAGDSYTLLISQGAHVIGPKLDYTNSTSASPKCSAVKMESNSTIEAPVVKAGILPSSSSENAPVFGAGGQRGNITVIAPDVELTNGAIGPSGLFYIMSTYDVNFTVIGGRVYGAGAITGQCVVGHGNASNNNGSVRMIGFQIPRSMTIVGSNGFADGAPAFVEAVGCDDGLGGHYEMPWGWATSRTDNNPPYLAAALPDSVSTAWSYRVYPRSVNVKNIMRLPIVKLYSGASGIKTITQQLLVANTMAPNARTLWITVEYTDAATGLPKHISSRKFSGDAIATSDANWSTTVWGLITLLKRKLEITTPTSVKQDSVITVSVCGILKSITANDIYFVDPDFGVN